MRNFSIRKNNNDKLQRGFSLMEIVVTLGVLMLVLGSITSLVVSLVQSRGYNQVVAEVEGQGTSVMQIITQTARNATSINTPSSGSSAATLSLALASSAVNPTVFSLSNGSIFVKEGTAALVALTSSQVVISNLSFQNLSGTSTPGIIRIQFTVSYTGSSGNINYSYSKVFIDSASLRQLILK